MLDPISVLLKFGFIVVLYLFLLYVARSALRDLRDDSRPGGFAPVLPPDATGMHAASQGLGPDPVVDAKPRLYVEKGGGLQAGSAYDLSSGLSLGRGENVDVRLEDPFASTRHVQFTAQGNLIVVEDLGSTNGTFLNEEQLRGPQPLHPGDRIRIGDTVFTYDH